MQRLKNLHASSLPRAVIHNGHARLKRPHERRRAGLVQTVVRNQVHIHWADFVNRAGELIIFILRQIAHIDHTETAIGNQQAYGVRVFRGIGRRLLKAFASGVRLACARQGRGNQVAIRREHLDVETFYGDRIAGLRQNMFSFIAERAVLVEADQAALSVSLCWARGRRNYDRHFSGKLLHAAHVIGVEVGDHEVIDLLYARRFRGRRDTVGVAMIKARPSGIHQHGFAAGRDEQGSLPTFHINRKNFQALGGRQCGSAKQQQHGWKQQFHGEIVARSRV